MPNVIFVKYHWIWSLCGVMIEQICYLAARKHKIFVGTSSASLMITSSCCVFMTSKNFTTLWKLVVAAINVDAYPFLVFSELTCSKTWYVFSGCTVPPDRKKTSLELTTIWKYQPRSLPKYRQKFFSYGIDEVASINLSANIAFGDFKVHH